MKNTKQIGSSTSPLKLNNYSELNEINVHDDKLIFLIGDSCSGKTQLLKDYIKIRKNINNVIVLGADSKSSIELEADNMYSFFNLPFGSMPEGFYSLLDYSHFSAIDEIIIDGFDFDRIDIFFGILRSIQLSLHKSSFKNTLDNVRLMFSGRPITKFEDNSIIECYKSSFYGKEISWPSPHVVSLDRLNNYSKNHGVEDYIRKKYNSLKSVYQAVQVTNDPGTDSVVISNSTQRVMEHNMKELDRLVGKMNLRNGYVKGFFDLHRPVPIDFHCKVGMKVVFTETVYNKRGKLLFSRGDVGKIVSKNGLLAKLFNSPFHLTNKTISVLLSNGKLINVKPFKWNSIKYYRTKHSIGGYPEYSSKVVGSYYQYPLVTGYSLEVNIARGLIFDHVHLDFTNIDKLVNFLKDWRAPLTLTISHRMNELLKKHFTKEKQTAA